MAGDIFGRSTEFGQAISADGARVSFDGFRIGLLAQQISISYAQQITRIFELSSSRQYYVIGRPQGNIQMTRIVGPIVVSTGFVEKFGNGCNAAGNTLSVSASAGCQVTGSGGLTGRVASVAYIATNVVLTNLVISVGAQDMLISENFQMMFVGLRSAA